MLFNTVKQNSLNPEEYAIDHTSIQLIVSVIFTLFNAVFLYKSLQASIHNLMR